MKRNGQVVGQEILCIYRTLDPLFSAFICPKELVTLLLRGKSVHIND